MRQLLLALLLCASTACSDPECGDNETKIGATCFPKGHGARDAAADSSSEPRTERDAGAHRDISIDSGGPAASVEAGATEASPSPPDGSADAAREGDAGCANESCAPRCGDGVVYAPAGETCEANSASPCPASCSDNDPCTTDTTAGSAALCNVSCTHKAITAPNNSDGCCPLNANMSNDSDCHGACGNGVVETGESCDGNCPTSCAPASGCVVNKLQGSGCGVQCVAATITQAASGDGCCPSGANHNTDADCPAVCGNKVVEAGEQCDDGNTQAGDGCNTCMFDDNTATFGDDRPGYVQCGDPKVTSCGPGQWCALYVIGPGLNRTYSPHCAASGDELIKCDGPEDCTAATPNCLRYLNNSYCTDYQPPLGSESDEDALCHVTSNCQAGATCNVLTGKCSH